YRKGTEEKKKSDWKERKLYSIAGTTKEKDPGHWERACAVYFAAAPSGGAAHRRRGFVSGLTAQEKAGRRKFLSLPPPSFFSRDFIPLSPIWQGYGAYPCRTLWHKPY